MVEFVQISPQGKLLEIKEVSDKFRNLLQMRNVGEVTPLLFFFIFYHLSFLYVFLGSCFRILKHLLLMAGCFSLRTRWSRHKLRIMSRNCIEMFYDIISFFMMMNYP
jgi:hypothetical protein